MLISHFTRSSRENTIDAHVGTHIKYTRVSHRAHSPHYSYVKCAQAGMASHLTPSVHCLQNIVMPQHVHDYTILIHPPHTFRSTNRAGPLMSCQSMVQVNQILLINNIMVHWVRAVRRTHRSREQAVPFHIRPV